MVLSRSTFGFAGPAQKLADQDSAGSLRIRGCDLYQYAITTSASTQGGFNASTIGPYWAALSPATISTRVQAVEEMFQWYCIRHLKVTYVPLVGTNTSGQLALGFSTDWDLQTAIATPTLQQVMELNPAVFTPVWQTAQVEMKNTGTKLYECYLSSESGENRIQGLLAARLSGSTFGTTYGQLWLDYVIDFYQPTPLLSSADREKRRLRASLTVSTEKENVAEERKAGAAAPAAPPRLVVESDPEDPSPPRYIAPPSSTPGTPGYTMVKIPSRK